MAENVRVVVRCRPMNNREHQMKCRNVLEIENCSVSVQNPSDPNAPAKTFTFDNVYDSMAPTESIYNDICYSLVENVLEGYNGTIFAYGQTGCGKTHTMQGPDLDVSLGKDARVPNSQRGIISRTFDHIFEAISVASGVRYLAFVSYLEIYNENIRDLLNPNDGINANHPLKEVPGLGVTVPTVSTHTVHDAHECNQLLRMGNKNRMVGATLMNATSSRSHSIFTISLEQIHKGDVESDTDNDVSIPVSGIRRGKLNLVDLAGSERQNKTGAVGERLKEATKINLSLSALGNVISALVDGKTKHIPYRDSKLTRLLQDSLGGNTKTLMISCISPADNNYDETISTLRYASRAKNISNKPRINEDPKDAKIREYQEEIMKLKKLLNTTNLNAIENSNNMVIGGSERDFQDAIIEEENTRLLVEPLESEQQVAPDEVEQQHGKSTIRSASPPVVEAEQKADEGSAPDLQMEALKRIEMIKKALIGGERANDTILKERRQKKKLDAQRRLSALAHALSRVEESNDRDLLQGHYANIKQELDAKNEYLKAQRHKIKALEREVSDLQSEFQLDRADYLETIRRNERNLKFYQQLMEKALPILRKAGKYWDPNEILQASMWNDDLKVWKLPEDTMNTFKLPPASNNTMSSKVLFENGIRNAPAAATPNNDIPETTMPNFENALTKRLEDDEGEDNDSSDIVRNYFRSTRQHTADHARQRKSINYWRDFAWRQTNTTTKSDQRLNSLNSSTSDRSRFAFTHLDHRHLQGDADFRSDGHIFSSRFPRNDANDNGSHLMNKTWNGMGGGELLLPAPLHNKMNPIVRGNTPGMRDTGKAPSPNLGQAPPNPIGLHQLRPTARIHMTYNDFNRSMLQKRPHRLSAISANSEIPGVIKEATH